MTGNAAGSDSIHPRHWHRRQPHRDGTFRRAPRRREGFRFARKKRAAFNHQGVTPMDPACEDTFGRYEIVAILLACALQIVGTFILVSELVAP
jgi:hypothetical protein